MWHCPGVQPVTGTGQAVGRARRKAGRVSPARPAVPARPPRELTREALRNAAIWVPEGDSIVVRGRLISGGMVYVGSGAAGVSRRRVEPCLIDPGKSVDWEDPDWAGHAMGYWPYYAHCGSRARAAYLAWLAGGRSDASANIGYVFLFFYGLERRLLADLGCDASHPETAGLLGEVRRLAGIYSSSHSPAAHSFAACAGALLGFFDAIRAAEGDVDPVPWVPGPVRTRVPDVVRVGVGKHAAAGTGIPAGWALSYLRHHWAAPRRMPAWRCRDEFDALFKIRYSARFGDGIKPRARRTVELSYYPASAGFSDRVRLCLPDVVDIERSLSTVDKLVELSEGCVESLVAYSRFVGRRPRAARTAVAAAALPDELVSSCGWPAVESLRGWATGLLDGGESAVVPFDDLLRRWSPGGAATLCNGDAAALAGLLSKFGVGVEPDVRFGSAVPGPGSGVVLFVLPQGAPSAPSAAYAAAVAIVHLAAVVAAAGGTVSVAGQQRLGGLVGESLGLDAAERARLDAYSVVLAASGPAMAGMKRRVGALAVGSGQVSAGS